MKRRGEIKRRSKVPKIFLFLFHAKKKKIEPVQNILYWFKTKLYQRYKLNYNIDTYDYEGNASALYC